MNITSIASMLLLIEAARLVFEYGIEPREEHFVEFTDSLYETFRRKHPEVAPNVRLYSWMPPQHTYKSREILTVTDEHKEALMGVAARISHHCKLSGGSFKSYTDKLHYAASVFPPDLSEGTRFAIRPNIKCV